MTAFRLRTGNPLVDSVAEHQAASEQSYDMYLSSPRYLAFVGLFFCWHQQTPAKIFPAPRLQPTRVGCRGALRGSGVPLLVDAWWCFREIAECGA